MIWKQSCALKRWILRTLTMLHACLALSLLTQTSPMPAARWDRFTSGVNMPYWMSLKDIAHLPRMTTWTDTKEMRTMREMGIRHVRLPFIADAVTKSYDPLVWDEAELRYLRQILREYRENDILVKLDFHPDDKFKHNLRDNPEAVMKFRNFWRGLAERIKDQDPEYLALEILNEPNLNKADQWWDIQRVLIRDLRQIMPRHTLVASADRWSGVDELIAMRPYEDRNVIYALHFYEPFIFTHQGAFWVDDHLGGWMFVRYPSDDYNLNELRQQARTSERRKVFERFESERWGPANINRRVQQVAQWARRHQVRVVANEFGTLRDRTPSASRAAWLRDTRRAFEDNGIGWSVWEWRGGMGMVTHRITTQEGYNSADWGAIQALGFSKPAPPR